jgi:hypothetical protein
VGHLGCAARGIPSVEVQPACEEFSKKQPQKSVIGLTVLGVLLVPVGAGLGAIGALAGSPEGIGLPFVAWNAAHDNAKANRMTRTTALNTCLETIKREHELGSDHPYVVRNLEILAHQYVEVGDLTRAEPLYMRALAIQEKTLGPQNHEVAETLDLYAALLRKMNRATEADALDARAQAIRARHEQQHEPEALPPSPTPQS